MNAADAFAFCVIALMAALPTIAVVLVRRAVRRVWGRS